MYSAETDVEGIHKASAAADAEGIPNAAAAGSPKMFSQQVTFEAAQKYLQDRSLSRGQPMGRQPFRRVVDYVVKAPDLQHTVNNSPTTTTTTDGDVGLDSVSVVQGRSLSRGQPMGRQPFRRVVNHFEPTYNSLPSVPDELWDPKWRILDPNETLDYWLKRVEKKIPPKGTFVNGIMYGLRKKTKSRKAIKNSKVKKTKSRKAIKNSKVKKNKIKESN
jgi:hypothetical protein